MSMTKLVVLGIFIWIVFIATRVAILEDKVQHIDDYLLMLHNEGMDDSKNTQHL